MARAPALCFSASRTSQASARRSGALHQHALRAGLTLNDHFRAVRARLAPRARARAGDTRTSRGGSARLAPRAAASSWRRCARSARRQGLLQAKAFGLSLSPPRRRAAAGLASRPALALPLVPRRPGCCCVGCCCVGCCVGCRVGAAVRCAAKANRNKRQQLRERELDIDTESSADGRAGDRLPPAGTAQFESIRWPGDTAPSALGGPLVTAINDCRAGRRHARLAHAGWLATEQDLRHRGRARQVLPADRRAGG
jgi:hypothetical protein